MISIKLFERIPVAAATGHMYCTICDLDLRLFAEICCNNVGLRDIIWQREEREDEQVVNSDRQYQTSRIQPTSLSQLDHINTCFTDNHQTLRCLLSRISLVMSSIKTL